MTVMGNDAVKCYYYNMSVFWNAVDSIKYLIAYFGEVENPSNIYLSIESVGLVIHKSPIVMEECLRLVSNVEYLDTIFVELSDIRNMGLWTHILENVMYNFGDLMKNIERGRGALNNWAYKEEKGHCLRATPEWWDLAALIESADSDEEVEDEDEGEVTDDWKAVAAGKSTCQEKCSRHVFCAAMEYDDEAKECRHWQVAAVGDGETKGATCQIKYKDYVEFGASLARILANIIYISPIDEDSWTPKNSNIVSEDVDNRSIKVPSSLFVKESKPMDVFEKFAINTTSKVQIEKKKRNQIRSE